MKRSMSYLLAGVSMTAAERAKGRFMRAPDGHEAPAAPPPAETPAPEPTPQHETSFADAFAAAAAEDETPTPAPAPTPPAAPAEGGSEAPAAPPPAEQPAAPTPPAAPEPPKQPDPAAPPAPAQPSVDDIVKGLTEAIKGSAPEAPGAPEQPQQAPIYTEDEIKTISEYESNWPDVSKAEALKRKAEYSDLLTFVFGEVQKVIGPMQEQMRVVGNTMHLGEVKALVPDYSENLEADVAKWVDEQPAYLQGAYKQVMQQGTSEEVADLIGRYRAATGTAAPAAPTPPAAPAGTAPAAPTPPAAPATELSKAAKQAVASLAPVSGERSSAPEGQDPGDFQSAFARYAAEAEKD